MKRLSFFLSVLCCAIICAEASAARPDTLRVLSIANSFGVDQVEHHLHEIGEADGHVIIIGSLFIPGCELATHYYNTVSNIPAYSYRKIDASGAYSKRPDTTMEYALSDEPWDVISFLQAPGMAGEVETYEPYLTDLIKYVKARVPKGCRMMLSQTWAYAADSTHPDFEKYGRSQKEAFEAVCNACRTEAGKHRMALIPSGTAVQNSRDSFNQENVTRDGYHMQPWFGRYLVACTFYESLFKTPVTGNSYLPPHLTEDRIRLARNCAHAACEHPYTVTRVDEKPDYVGWYFASLEKVDKIRSYTLPEALTMNDGRKVETPEQWYSERRPEILGMIETEMYGKAPGRIEGTTWEVVDEDRQALGGKAIRKQIKIDFHRGGQYIMVLMYLPNNAEGKVPVFLGLNFEGNATVNADPAILYPDPEHARQYGIYTQKERGSLASRWPVEEIISRGYGVATFHTSDVDPDFDDGFRNGVSPFIYREGQDYPDPDQWGTISAWAWGMSRVMDYLETDPDVDASRVSTIGHSRLGKTALLAGARDERFAMVVSNCSGCCGAALSRRNYGETVESIIHLFPHWFCSNFYKYSDRLDDLPFDQHEFLALIAPRPLYVGSAEDDAWADPTGERISLQEAQKVYDFLGLDRSLTGHHIHEGVHDITSEDWNHYMDFADRVMKKK